jgi:feruloyl esterase
VVVFSDTNQARLKTELVIKYLHNDPPRPDFKLADLKFDRATFDSTTRLHYLYDATDPDLAAFAKAGHKLLLWQGLADATVLPVYATLYYTALQNQMGAAAVDRFARLYLLPGVAHCGGGDGPAFTDLLTPLMLWVERGVAPGALIASHANLTRPVYPYPYTEKYTGTGSTSDAANFVKGPARPVPIAQWSNWFGSGFYKAGSRKWCTESGASMDCKNSR